MSVILELVNLGPLSHFNHVMGTRTYEFYLKICASRLAQSAQREVHVRSFEGAKCHITIWTVLLWFPNDLLVHAYSFWLED